MPFARFHGISRARVQDYQVVPTAKHSDAIARGVKIQSHGLQPERKGCVRGLFAVDVCVHCARDFCRHHQNLGMD